MTLIVSPENIYRKIIFKMALIYKYLDQFWPFGLAVQSQINFYSFPYIVCVHFLISTLYIIAKVLTILHANLINLIVIVVQSYEPMTFSDFRTSSSAEVQSFLKVNFGSAHRNLKVARDQVISGRGK